MRIRLAHKKCSWYLELDVMDNPGRWTVTLFYYPVCQLPPLTRPQLREETVAGQALHLLLRFLRTSSSSWSISCSCFSGSLQRQSDH